jgi:hypothetical protein
VNDKHDRQDEGIASASESPPRRLQLLLLSKTGNTNVWVDSQSESTFKVPLLTPPAKSGTTM